MLDFLLVVDPRTNAPPGDLFSPIFPGHGMKVRETMVRNRRRGG